MDWWQGTLLVTALLYLLPNCLSYVIHVQLFNWSPFLCQSGSAHLVSYYRAAYLPSSLWIYFVVRCFHVSAQIQTVLNLRRTRPSLQLFNCCCIIFMPPQSYCRRSSTHISFLQFHGIRHQWDSFAKFIQRGVHFGNLIICSLVFLRPACYKAPLSFVLSYLLLIKSSSELTLTIKSSHISLLINFIKTRSTVSPWSLQDTILSSRSSLVHRSFSMRSSSVLWLSPFSLFHPQPFTSPKY